MSTASFDRERFLLDAGARRLVKRELVPLREVDDLLATLSLGGYAAGHDTALAYGAGATDDLDFDAARRGECGAFVTVFFAHSQATVDEALAAERRCVLETDRPVDAQLADFARLGELLGYPSCCVQAYSAGLNAPFFRRGAAAYHLDSLHRTVGRLDARVNNVSRRVEPLISHAPCSYACRESAALADLVLAELERREPGAAQRAMEELRRPVIYWSQSLLYELAGDWCGPDFIVEDARPLAEPHARVDEWLIPGAALRPALGAVMVETPDGRRGTLLDVARPLELPFFMDWTGTWTQHPARPSLRLIELETAAESFMGNPLPVLAGDLLALGLEARCERLAIGRSDDVASPVVAQFLSSVAREPPSVVVASVTATELVPAGLSELGVPFVELRREEAYRPGAAGPLDGVGLRRLSSLIEALAALPNGPQLQGALVTVDTGAVSHPFAPVFSWAATWGAGPRERVLWCFPVNSGCPFALRYGDVDASTYLPAEGVRLRGCNFCADGGNYEVVPWRRQIPQRLAEEMAHVAARAPHIRGYVVHDTFPLPYLPGLVREVAARRITGKQLLLQCRPDWLLRHRSTVEEVALALAGLGWETHYYLVGFENFSQDELDRLDKGLTVAQNLDAISMLRELESRHRGVFFASQYRAHGFLLFNPWTTLEDLETNAKVLAETRFHELRSHYILTRLRLYPWLPHYHRAKAAGLFAEGFDQDAESSARRVGYLPETPWRSADRRSDVVFGVVAALEGRFSDASHAELLSLACRFARTYEGPASERVAAFDAAFASALAALIPATSPPRPEDSAPPLAGAGWEREAWSLVSAGDLEGAEALARAQGDLTAGSTAESVLQRVAIQRRYADARVARDLGDTPRAVGILRSILSDAPDEDEASRMLTSFGA